MKSLKLKPQSSAADDAVKTATAAKNRIESIDILRGVVMVIMALDHVRMYFSYGTLFANPTDLSTASPLIFFTRWITHFCAPVFVFLAGTGAFLYGVRNGVKAVSQFLLTRGLWLLVVECTIVTFSWTFDITFSRIMLQVIWVIGLSMVCLSGLVYLPRWIIFAVGFLLAGCHNALDSITAQGSSLQDLLWYALHQQRVVSVSFGFTFDFHYPLLPWIGVICLGYLFGELFKPNYDRARRKRLLLTLGTASIILFVLLRAAQMHFAGAQRMAHDALLTNVLEFFNTSKYPPSVLFLLMTMGPSFFFLAAIEKIKNRVTDFFIVFGRVPFFYYIVHIYLVHALAFLGLAYAGRSLSENILNAQAYQTQSLATFGFGLGVVYAVWIVVIVIMYPLSKWYGDYKTSHRHQWWLSYL